MNPESRTAVGGGGFAPSLHPANKPTEVVAESHKNRRVICRHTVDPLALLASGAVPACQGIARAGNGPVQLAAGGTSTIKVSCSRLHRYDVPNRLPGTNPFLALIVIANGPPASDTSRP